MESERFFEQPISEEEKKRFDKFLIIFCIIILGIIAGTHFSKEHFREQFLESVQKQK